MHGNAIYSYLRRIPEIMEVTITKEAQSIRSEGENMILFGPFV
jgi:hypothetical protein